MTVTLNEINSKLDRMIEQTTDKPSHQSPCQSKPINTKYIDLGIYSDIEGEPQSRGYYVHPKLINYIAIWSSPKYAYTVTQIMDSINERIQLIHQLDDTTSMAVQADIIFNQELEEKDAINNQLRQQIQDKDNAINSMTTRLVPQDKQYDYIYSVELINEDIDGNGNNQPCDQGYAITK
ncbi:MAG: hypothetical protein EZS28_040906, partial [Streblomastix strix]